MSKLKSNNQKSTTSTKSIIDEIIVVDVKLFEVASSPMLHRKFAFFGGCKKDKLEITKANLEEALGQIILDGTKDYVNMWFNSGGTSLTIYNYVKGGNVNTDVVEQNIILAGLQLEDQQAIYNVYKATTKNLFLTKYLSDTLEVVPARTSYVFIATSDEASPYTADYPMFQYLAPYTIQYKYRKNNFESSNLQGGNFDSTQPFVDGKFGTLLYIENLTGYYFYNMVDTKGFNLNWNFLQGDIKAKIQADLLTLIANNNSYNQSAINTWHNTCKNSLIYFKNMGLINGFTTIATTYSEQTIEDLKMGVYKSIQVNYSPAPEIRELHVDLVEDLTVGEA